MDTKNEKKTLTGENNTEKLTLTEEEIINQDYFKSVFDVGVICGICQNVLMDPHSCSVCQNCFCKDCLEQWKKKGNICPFRCENSVMTPNRVMKNVLAGLKFKCKRGCNEEINYLQYEEHYNKNCSKIDFKTKFIEVSKENFDLKEKIAKLTKENEELKKNINGSNNESVKFIDLDGGSYKSVNHSCALKLENKRDGFTCSKCKVKYDKKEERSGYTCCYCCYLCGYFLCLNCHFEEVDEINFKSKQHKHNLKYVWTGHYNWKCDICKKGNNLSNHGCYHCSNCQFDLCKTCKKKEEYKKDCIIF